MLACLTYAVRQFPVNILKDFSAAWLSGFRKYSLIFFSSFWDYFFN